jgi:chitinase
MGSTDFSKMASSSQTRSTFISTTIDYLKSHGFDGLDLDWEYPSNITCFIVIIF